MKVVFNGVLEERKQGCQVCGKRTVSKNVFVTKKEYILPSGRIETFYLGKAKEVSDNDGKFLLLYTTTDSNGTRKVFSEVK